jgi:hypothetical protein
MLDDINSWITEMREQGRDVALNVGWLLQQLAAKVDDLQTQVNALKAAQK